MCDTEYPAMFTAYQCTSGTVEGRSCCTAIMICTYILSCRQLLWYRHTLWCVGIYRDTIILSVSTALLHWVRDQLSFAQAMVMNVSSLTRVMPAFFLWLLIAGGQNFYSIWMRCVEFFIFANIIQIMYFVNGQICFTLQLKILII